MASAVRIPHLNTTSPESQPDGTGIYSVVSDDPGQGPASFVEPSGIGDLMRLKPLPPQPDAFALEVS